MFYLVKGKLDKSSLDYSSQIDSFQLKSLHSKIDTKNKQDLDFFCHISDLPGVEKVTTTEFLRLEDLANDPKMHHDTVIMPFTDKEMQEAFSLENGGLNREKLIYETRYVRSSKKKIKRNSKRIKQYSTKVSKNKGDQ